MKPQNIILIAMLIASPTYLKAPTVNMSTGKIRPTQQPLVSKTAPNKPTPMASENYSPTLENKAVGGMEYTDFSKSSQKPPIKLSTLFKSKEQKAAELEISMLDKPLENQTSNMAPEKAPVQTSFAFDPKTYGKSPARTEAAYTPSQEPHQLTLVQEQSAQRSALQISSPNNNQLQKRNALQNLQKKAPTDPESARTLQILQEKSTSNSSLQKLFTEAQITDASLGSMRPVILPAPGARNSAGALTPPPLLSQRPRTYSGSLNNRQSNTPQTVGLSRKSPLAGSNPFDQDPTPATPQPQATPLTATTTAAPKSLRERFQLIQDQTSNLFRKNNNIRTRINNDGTKVTELFAKTDTAKSNPLTQRTTARDGKSYTTINSSGKTIATLAPNKTVTKFDYDESSNLIKTTESERSGILGRTTTTTTTQFNPKGKRELIKTVDNKGNEISAKQFKNDGNSYVEYDLRNKQPKLTREVKVNKDGTTETITYTSKNGGNGTDKSSKSIITDPVKAPDSTTIITRGKNGEQVKTEITNILGKTETVIDHTTNVVSIKTQSGHNITYQPDGSFTVNGSKTVIDFKVNADGVTTLQSYSKEGWLKKPTVSEAITNVGAQPQGKYFGKFGNEKPVMEQLPDGSTKITTRAKDSNKTVMAEVIIDPQGKVTYKRKNQLDGNLSVVAETKPQTDGSFELSVLKPDNTYSTRVVANDGSIAKKWVKADGSTVTSLNNGPDITTKNSGNKLESSIKNKDGSTTTIINDNDQSDYKLTISNDGTNSQPHEVDLKQDMNQLLDNRNSNVPDHVDAMAVKILNNTQIINSAEYKNLKNKIVKEAESQRDAQFSQDQSAVAVSNKQYFTNVWQDIISLKAKKPEGFIEG